MRKPRGEGIAAVSVHVAGNTLVDALLMTVRQDLSLPPPPATERFLLVTAHQHGHFGAPLEQICTALADLVYFEAVEGV